MSDKIMCIHDMVVTANVVREVQSASGEELRPLFGRTLMPSVLHRAFKGKL